MPLATGAVDASENGLDLGKLQVLDFSEGGPLEGDAQNPLCRGQVFKMMSADIAKEAMESAQTHIPCAGLVVSARFQVLEEGRDPLVRQLLQHQLTGVSLLACRKLKKELEAVAIAVESIDAHRALLGEVIGKKGMEG